jgi:hypothetical protein
MRVSIYWEGIGQGLDIVSSTDELENREVEIPAGATKLRLSVIPFSEEQFNAYLKKVKEMNVKI